MGQGLHGVEERHPRPPELRGSLSAALAGDLGFYDLRLRETYLEQVALAERYGVHGFCFYYYWFDGKRLLERPLERLLEDRRSTFRSASAGRTRTGRAGGTGWSTTC